MVLDVTDVIEDCEYDVMLWRSFTSDVYIYLALPILISYTYMNFIYYKVSIYVTCIHSPLEVRISFMKKYTVSWFRVLEKTLNYSVIGYI